MNSKTPKPVAVVVNDDPTQLGILAGLLTKAGIEAVVFDGVDAVLAVMDPAAPPALIVTDLYMPGIDGWRFCRLLRSPEYAAFNKVPILVVSATFAGDHPERIAVDVGADAFLPAPVDGKAFTALALALLGGKETRSRPRALIVDDDEGLTRLIERAFTGQGYQVDTASTIRKAKETFETPYQVAVLDYYLSDGTSDELLDAFRVTQPDCACLMMTGDPSPRMTLDWMKRGAAAILHKPFAPEVLIELCARARRERALLRAEDLLEARTRELRESEGRHRTLIEGLPDIIMRFDRGMRHLFVSDNIRDRAGIEAARYIGKTHAELGFPEALCRFREESIQRVFDSGAPFETEFTLEDKTGAAICFNWRLIPERDAQGAVSSVLSISRDITAHRKAEQEYQTLFLMMLDGVALHEIILDAAGVPADYRFLAVNPAFERMTGLKSEHVVGRTVLEILPGTERHWIETYGKVALTGEPAFFENHAANLGKHFEVTAFRPAPGRFVCIFQDITARKQAEAEREKLHAQLVQAQKMESIGRLAGGVAHDFNNMLQNVLGAAELALERAGPDDFVRVELEDIRKAALRSADLTRQLLAFARKQTVAPRVLDLNEKVTDLLKMLRRLLGEDITLVWKPAANLWPVRMDPAQVDAILTNLCVNARDAIDGTDRIAVETCNAVLDEDYSARHTGCLPGEYVKLAVSDNGCGMNRETMEHVFEPFFTTKEPGKGTGLGLASIYGAVVQNGGSIDVASEPDRGTTFNIYLPRHQAHAEDSEAPRPQAAARGDETILLVEDEPAILNTTTRILRRLGYTMLTSATPGEAIRLAREHAGPINLLMTDVVMPEMNGWDLARNLQAIHPDIRRLFMSGYTAEVIAPQGVLEPGVHFIQKPFSRDELAAKLREVLQ